MSMKLSLDCFGDNDLMWKQFEKKAISFAFIHEHDKEKTENGKKQVNGIRLNIQKAKMLRDNITAWINIIEREEASVTAITLGEN